MKKYFSDVKNQKRLFSFVLVTSLYILLQIFISLGTVSTLLKNLLVPVCCYISAALALNLVVGILGELSLGQAGFMSVGAFAGVIASSIVATFCDIFVVRILSALFFGAFCAGVLGVLVGIPVLKLQGDYLAIVTLAFGQIVKSLIGNIYIGIDQAGLQFSLFTNKLNLSSDGKMLLSGPAGATGISRIANFTCGFVLVFATLLIIYNLINSKSGRAIMACRDNAIAASSVGIDVAKYKLLAFSISAAIAGAAGALYSLNYSSITPGKFDFNQSILILVYVVLGGLGNMNGTIISTIVLILLPELLRQFQDYRMLVYAIVLILIMIVTNNPKIKAKLSDLTSKKGAD